MLELGEDINFAKTSMMKTHQITGATSEAGESPNHDQTMVESQPKHTWKTVCIRMSNGVTLFPLSCLSFLSTFWLLGMTWNYQKIYRCVTEPLSKKSWNEARRRRRATFKQLCCGSWLSPLPWQIFDDQIIIVILKRPIGTNSCVWFLRTGNHNRSQVHTSSVLVYPCQMSPSFVGKGNYMGTSAPWYLGKHRKEHSGRIK